MVVSAAIRHIVFIVGVELMLWIQAQNAAPVSENVLVAMLVDIPSSDDDRTVSG